MGRRSCCWEENADKISKPAVQPACGAIAQLGERIVRNDEVVGSIPTSSTINSIICKHSSSQSCHTLSHENQNRVAGVALATSNLGLNRETDARGAPIWNSQLVEAP